MSEYRVTLSPIEMAMAGQVGLMRGVCAIRDGKTNSHGFASETDPAGWGIHVEGAMGELAFCKALGIHWAGTVNTYRSEGDVGQIEIKTRSRHSYDLLVRKDDHNDRPFVLVTGVAPLYWVRGWLRGAEAKMERFLKEHGNRPPAYFVPANELHHISTLPLLGKGE